MCLLGSMKWLLHLGIALTSRITFQETQKTFLLPSGSLLCFQCILNFMWIPCREMYFQFPSRVGHMPLGLHLACGCEVSFPDRSMVPSTTKWNRAPETHKSTAQTACGAALHPAASRSMNVREFMCEFRPWKVQLP